MAYKANRRGHAPGHLREAFLEYLSDNTGAVGVVEIEEQEKPLTWPRLQDKWPWTFHDQNMNDAKGIHTPHWTTSIER